MCDFADDPDFLRALLAFGIKKEDVKTMLVDNPAKLIRLD